MVPWRDDVLARHCEGQRGGVQSDSHNPPIQPSKTQPPSIANHNLIINNHAFYDKSTTASLALANDPFLFNSLRSRGSTTTVDNVVVHIFPKFSPTALTNDTNWTFTSARPTPFRMLCNLS